MHVKKKTAGGAKSKATGKKATVSRRARTTVRKVTRDYNDRWLAIAWVVPAVLVVLTVTLLVKPATRYPMTLTSAKLVELFQKAPGESVGDRIAYWSENLLREPDLLKPVAPGPAIEDTAPLFPKQYDCTTYVETVGALARSREGTDLADQIIAIRYKNGKIAYDTRNHFPEADWIPNNENSGVLRDITVKVARRAGFMAAFAHKDVDRVAWLKSHRPERAVATADASSDQTVTVRLPYIPLDRMLDALEHLPQGTVLNIVRENNDRFPNIVTHQGFLVWKNGVAYFRHASQKRDITEVPLTFYIQLARKMPWRVLGFNLNAFEG
jgi:hypothetical protein